MSKEFMDPARWVDSPIFADFKEREIKRVLKMGMLEWKGEGVPIFLRGDTGKEMFLLAEGEVRIHDFVDGQDIQIAVLGPGEVFGEMAALSKQPRSAHATSLVDSMLFSFTEEKLGTFIGKEPKIAARLMANLFRIAASRLEFHLPQAGNRMSDRMVPVSSDEMPKLFAGIKTDLKKQILAGGEVKVYKPKQVLFKRGEMGDRLYVVLHGEVHVVVPQPHGPETMAIISEGDMLGEVALASKSRRTAAAVAVKPTQTLEISTDNLDKLLRRHPKAAVRLLLNLFRITAARVRATTSLALDG